MNRGEFIETIEGQTHLSLRRSLDMVFLQVDQEPQSKNGISNQGKRDFRNKIKEQLNKYKRRAFRGKIYFSSKL